MNKEKERTEILTTTVLFLSFRCKQWLSKNDKVTYAILYNTLEDHLAATTLGDDKPEDDKKKAKGNWTSFIP